MITVMPEGADIFTTTAPVLVNPVNCVGVMGAGLAKQFKEKYPRMFAEYRKQVAARRMRIGKMWVWFEDANRTIVNFPTKDHWRQKSRLDEIQLGLNDLRTLCQLLRIKHIAVPALGCGLGELNWADVTAMIVDTFYDDEDLNIELYSPLPSMDRT